MKANSYIYNLGRAFHETSRTFADCIALAFLDGTWLTFAELEELSNRAANWLLQHGIGRNKVVAIFNEKTSRSYALMLGCLKIGAPYTNLDPSSPPERLKRMLGVCKPALVFAGAGLSREPWFQLPVIDYTDDAFGAELERTDGSFPAVNSGVSGNTPAYIMFTSGSTGFPKGAVMSHRNVLHFIDWCRETFAITYADRLTNLNPMHFDNSVFDFYGSLFNGASMTPVSESLLKNPRRLLDALNPASCSIWFSVPSLLVFALKTRALRHTDLPSLRTISFGGEGFPKAQLRALFGLLGDRVQFMNVYGPTECTCICSSYPVRPEDLLPDDLLPLGPVAPNFDFLVIDDWHHPVTPGEPGELCLGGPNVGLGYYGNPEKSHEVFIQNPLHNDYREILYRTGDLVRYDTGKDQLFFCGRKDNQVKRMGYRIELEEIEAALGSLPYIDESGVVFVKNGSDVGRIVACVSANKHDELELIADLRRVLPPYMIPDRVAFLDVLPKNPNGKIDRRALHEMESIR